MKNVAREATNGVIYGESGEIVKNGLRVVCPRCGEIGLYPGHGGSVNIWTVGAIERRECTKCRKQFHAISLTVPADMTPEEFYLKIKEGGSCEASILLALLSRTEKGREARHNTHSRRKEPENHLLAVQTPPLRGGIRDFPERRCAP